RPGPPPGGRRGLRGTPAPGAPDRRGGGRVAARLAGRKALPRDRGIHHLGFEIAMDEGHPIHYLAVPRGTPVYGADGVEVGRVVEMLDNQRENIFDGVVFRGSDGRSRFADAPEVARTAERAVTLTIGAD